jgi:SAM-dependent methyltransferase
MENSYLWTNAYFKRSDPVVTELNGYAIPSGWWSRGFEYRYAMEFTEPKMTVADMGMGWNFRPLYTYLATVCDFVYGVDHHKEILDLPPMQRGAFVVADFSQPIDAIPAASLDRIFCISVLEELINYEQALGEFKRLLKPDGRIVLTCDMPYDDAKPAHEKYKGVKLDDLEAAMVRVGLVYDGSVCRVKPDDALYHAEFNLAVFHAILKIKK